MTVDEWVDQVWTLLSIRAKTLYDYKHFYRHNLQAAIGHMAVDKVDSAELQRALLVLPPQTARHTLMVAKSIFREAAIYNITKNNPTVGLRTAPIQQKERKFLTWDEVDALDWGSYNNQIRFLAAHGLRWSEATVLTQEDIHDGSVWVNRSFYGPCKSKTSVRRIPYLGYFAEFPLTYKAIRKAASLHDVTVHSFRRTYAYLLKTQGIHVTTAQRLMGHSDPMMTLKIYTSVLDDEIDAAGEMLKMHLGKMS
jgi:integrase